MSIQRPIPHVMLDTVLDDLASLFPGTDPDAARETAYQAVQEHDPQTMEELALAADIISFSHHAVQALGEASEPGLPYARVVRLRGSAVSLSRQGHKARRKLELLKKSRATAAQPLTAEPPAIVPPQETAAPPAIAAPTAPTNKVGLEQAVAQVLAPWTGSDRKRLMAATIAENSRRHAARHQPQSATG